MLHQVLSWMYERPMWLYWVLLAVALVLWGVLGYLCRRRRFWVYGNIAIFVITAGAIACITLLLRGAGEQGVVLSPAALFESAKLYPDVYIQMQLNAVLFVPLGMTLPYGVFHKIKRPVLWSVIMAGLFSVGIECGQYLFSKGYSELTDVVLNAGGAALGVIAYLLTQVIAKYYKKREDHELS